MSDDAAFVEAIEAAAYRDLYRAAPPPLAAALGLATREIAGATLLLAGGIADPFFNRVLALGVLRPTAEADLEAIAGAYRAAGVKRWWVHVAPLAQPASLAQWLQARGYALPPRKTWAKFIYRGEPPPPVATGLEVRAARPGEESALAEAICAAYGMPAAFAAWFAAAARRERWRGFVATDGGSVVGGGLLYFGEGGAWLGAGGVRPQSRRRHGHRALMTLRIREALAAGCGRVATETGEAVADEPNPSLANMRACGFRKLYSRLNYDASA